MVRPMRMFAVASPGLEDLVHREIVRKVPKALNVRRTQGGVSFEGHRNVLFEANLKLRTATRVLVRIAKFKALDRHQFLGGFANQDWSSFFPPNGPPIKFSVSARKSKLIHTGLIEELATKALSNYADRQNEVDESDVRHVIININHDEVYVSINSSGVSLTTRGYRGQDDLKMPLRETAAAGMLYQLGIGESTMGLDHVAGTIPIVDPFCGSGTILTEGAMMASNLAPGLIRIANDVRFAFERWPIFQNKEPFNDLVLSVVDECIAPPSSGASKPFIGSDRDKGVVEVAKVHTARANVHDWVHIEHKALGDLSLPPTPGFIASNPPYGPRAGATAKLRPLFSSLGDFAASPAASGWRMGLLMPTAKEARKLLFATGLKGIHHDPMLISGRRVDVFHSNVLKPKPAMPKPAVTEPAVPESVARESAVPEPNVPEAPAQAPEPTITEPAAPEPIARESTSPKAIVPETSAQTPEPTITEPVVPETSAQSPESAITESAAPEASVQSPEPTLTEPVVPETSAQSAEPEIVQSPESTPKTSVADATQPSQSSQPSPFSAPSSSAGPAAATPAK